MDNVILLPAWLTPAFAQMWLSTGKLGTSRNGNPCSQVERYTAIAQSRDWDRMRNWPLAWAPPYTGRFLQHRHEIQVAQDRSPVEFESRRAGIRSEKGGISQE